ncbi:MAG: hypothetical protein GXP28_09390 [Planctomycetes bacterium]|nr:hypothetical protein [Planctomycetota bacterium]
MDTYARNQLDRQATLEQLQVLHERLSDLVENPLEDIRRLLGELKRKSQPPESTTIAALAERQQTVIKTLQQAIDSLSLENELAKFESDLAQIEARQRELANRSQREILNDQPQADKQASLDQNQLSRQFAKLVMQMSRAMENSGSLSDVVSLARDLAVQTTMRAAADHLAQQQIGKAAALQQASSDHLRQLRERLVTPREDPPKSSSPADPGDQPEGQGEAGTKPNPPSSPTRQNQNRSTEETTTQLINDLWGNLPQRQREQILQPLSETFLPKYAEAIEAYFRELAEPTSKTKAFP